MTNIVGKNMLLDLLCGCQDEYAVTCWETEGKAENLVFIVFTASERVAEERQSERRRNERRSGIVLNARKATLV